MHRMNLTPQASFRGPISHQTIESTSSSGVEYLFPHPACGACLGWRNRGYANLSANSPGTDSGLGIPALSGAPEDSGARGRAGTGRPRLDLSALKKEAPFPGLASVRYPTSGPKLRLGDLAKLAPTSAV